MFLACMFGYGSGILVYLLATGKSSSWGVAGMAGYLAVFALILAIGAAIRMTDADRKKAR
jgi:hypothetical protein